MIEPNIIKNKKSLIKPQEYIRSWKVEIPINIVKDNNIYIYDVMRFNSIQEYDDWKLQELKKTVNEKDKEIQELKNKISELEVEPPLVDRTETNSNNIENHESLLNDLSQMIVEISTLQQI